MLRVRDLRVGIGAASILRGVDLDMAPGETVGLVGESGSGKSMLALALIGLLPDAARADGSVRFEGVELLHAAEPELCAVRGSAWCSRSPRRHSIPAFRSAVRSLRRRGRMVSRHRPPVRALCWPALGWPTCRPVATRTRSPADSGNGR